MLQASPATPPAGESERPATCPRLFNNVEVSALPIPPADTQEPPGNVCAGPDGLAGLRGYPGVGKPAAGAWTPDTAQQLWDDTAQLAGTGGC